MIETAEKMNLREVQVYKWIWDTKQRQDRNTADLIGCQLPLEASFNIEHKDAKGNLLTPFEVQFALQLYKEADESENMPSELARIVGINTE